MPPKIKKNKILFDKLKQVLKVIKRRPVLNYLETHIVDHCNLNCKACSHYSPLSGEKFVDIDKYQKNMEILAKKISFKNIRLLGGEPLLHPKIISFIEVTRNAFPKANIAIVTNGSLLFDMPDKFWEACKINKLSLDVSKYPLFQDRFDDMIALVNSKGVKVGDVHVCDEMALFHNPNGDSDTNLAFKYCGIKRYKILKGDKLYTCPKSAYLHLYNEYFKLPCLKDEGVSIVSNSAKKIIKHINNPINTCKFCSYAVMLTKWEQSERRQDDWNVIKDANQIPIFHKYVLKEIINQGKK